MSAARPVRRNPPLPLLLPFSAALLLLLAQPPFSLPILSFSALAPLVMGLGALDGGEGDGRRAAWMGVVFGVVYWGTLLLWVPLVVAPVFPWAYPGYGAQVGLLAGLAALMAWAAHRLHAGVGVPLPLAFPLAWVAMEWLKAHFPLGLSFPWLGLGISMTPWPEALGMAEWTGEAGVAFWLATVNGLVGALLLGRLRRDPLGEGSSAAAGKMVALTLLVLAGPLLLGLGRSRTLPLQEGPWVASIGTGIPVALRLQEVEGSRAALRQIEPLVESLQEGRVDLVVLPEATVALPLDGDSGGPYREILKELSRTAGAPLLVGALGTASGASSRGPSLGEEPNEDPTNSAFLVDSTGVAARYDKVRLVPGMEWERYVRGEEGAILEVDGWSLAPSICYESLFSSGVRAQGRRGAAILVNLSSDVWFGEGEGIRGVFLRQHPAHLVMRAVETRMSVARAANGGVSLLLDPVGRPLAPPLLGGGGLIQARLPVFQGRTLFSLTGDLVGPLSLLIVLSLLLFPSYRPPQDVGTSA